jgi:purine-binding chemotaxis protein CheW
MDISKIRKKAKEKEKEAQGKPLPRPHEKEGPEKAETDAGKAGEAASGGQTTDVPPFVGSTADVSASKAPEPSPAIIGADAASGKEDAPASEGGEGQEKIVELLTFNLSTEEFAFRVSEVEEIIRHQRITPVPATPDYVMGITSLRGKIIPVIDLKRRIVLRGGRGNREALGGSASAKDEKVLILLGPKGPIGAIIDRVIGVVRLPGSKILEPPAHLLDEERRFVDGVVVLDRRFVSIVSSEEALNIEVM